VFIDPGLTYLARVEEGQLYINPALLTPPQGHNQNKHLKYLSLVLFDEVKFLQNPKLDNDDIYQQ
jgi:hypothetical protein